MKFLMGYNNYHSVGDKNLEGESTEGNFSSWGKWVNFCLLWRLPHPQPISLVGKTLRGWT